MDMKKITILLMMMCGILRVSAQTQEFKNALNQAYSTGSAEWQYKVAVLYNEGKGSGNRFNGMMSWLTKAANQGHIPAIMWLAENYLNAPAYADGRAYKDYYTALNLYKKAAEQKDKLAYWNIARIYADGGYGVERDKSQALMFAETAVSLGCVDAVYGLQRMYLYGSSGLQDWQFGYRLGVAKNEAKAVQITDAYVKKYKDYQPVNELAYMYAQMKPSDMASAHRTIDRAISACPQHADYVDSKGEFYLMQGDKVNARRMYDKCLQLDPKWGNKRTALYKGLFGN